MKTMNLKSVLGLVLLSVASTAGVVYYALKGDSDRKLKTTICLDYREDKVPKLQKKFIDDMKKNYYDNQLNILNQQNTKSRIELEGGDTQSVRFDLEKLKNFIYHIEKYAQKHNLESKNLGIRMHYISYPNEENWSKYEELKNFDKEGKYRNRMSIILVPTNKVKNEKGILVDADYNLLTNEKLDFMNYISPTAKMQVSNSKNTSVEVLAENHGSMFPPF